MRKLRSVTRNISVEYWVSVNDMPLENWILCNDGDARFARKKVNTTDKETDKETTKDGENWTRIYDSYIKKYGLSKLYLKMLEAMRKKALLELDYVETWEQFKLTEIQIEVEKLKNMVNNNGEGMTIEQSLVHLSKWVGYYLDKKKITVVDYFNLMAEYGKAS